ncbi:dephospho-CoA kinase [Rhodanobacter sp. C06]|uniref:dephospho-CoA kinase n=1 Tax=Rhodanobacter sp. C06 TaxID=1945854 RepID=UPI000986AC2B|nr:dephospho-CoA kinase [Rhodanobacter sp. C06]OOG36094.1 dephospho-CoA kinase [Rhodanobacter sp. C06]OOG36193.1 dephospho-CoA kinase [Rhodanobacter sp. C06]
MNSYVVALTGGIAAGKSAVTRRFAALGVPVHDADVAAREVVVPGSEGLAAVVSAFGDEVLDAEGRLDRPAMRHRVFADPAARRTLEGIIHPRVRQWLHECALAGTTPYCLLAIPLLAENIGHYRWVDRVLLVDAPVELQLARLIARDGIDEALARRMLAQQARREQRLTLAHDVIDNSGDEAALDAAVAKLHQRYLVLAVNR